MPNKLSKRFITGVILCAVVLAGSVILSASAWAATDQEIQAAAQAGVQYLSDNQSTDGSISGYGGESDWSAVAIEASGQDASGINNGGQSLTDFLESDAPSATTPTTSIERKIIAVSAVGGDISNFGGVNYNELLLAQHADSQIGSATLLNDDIFGVIAIEASGNPSLTHMAQDGLNYFLSHQNSDGGFSYTTDTCAYCGSDSNDTAAAIIAIYAAENLGLTINNSGAKGAALVYLLSTQLADGGFGYDIYSPSDGSSTAWALMALNTIGKSATEQANQARDWLLRNQNADGGFSFGAYGISGSDTFTTAHAITALLGSTWLLSPTPLTVEPSIGGKGGDQPVSVQSGIPSSNMILAATTINPSSENDGTSIPQKSPAATLLAVSDSDKESVSLNTAASSMTAKYAAVTLLVLVAVSWFVLESRKAREVN